MLKIFGKNPRGTHKETLMISTQHNGKSFQNISETIMLTKEATPWKMMKNYASKPKDFTPSRALPSVKLDLKKSPIGAPALHWFGHSSYLLKIDEKNILVDPVFSNSAAPVSFMVKAFEGSNAYAVEDLPVIDLLILTHDHYDHLDYKTLVALKPRVKKIVCSMGLSAHLTHWGFNKTDITELDWWQSHEWLSFKITATPARHFSGRGLVRAQTLWSSFVLQSSTHRIFIGGDSGYDGFFKEIGEKFGPFDLAILECGQYNALWPLIHMQPELTVQAAFDLGAKLTLPVHWGKFALAFHPWKEPIQRFVVEAKAKGLRYTTPMIGERMILGEIEPTRDWYSEY